MEAGELEYASKSIKVLSISEGTISQDPDKNVEAAIKVSQIEENTYNQRHRRQRSWWATAPKHWNDLHKNRPYSGRNQPSVRENSC